MELKLAKQRACQNKGMTYFVTSKGIKTEIEVKLSGYEVKYKVLFDGKECKVWGADGKLIAVPRNVRNSSDEKVGKNSKRQGSKTSTDKRYLE